MSTDERTAWYQLALMANKLGRDGKRVIAVDVIPPHTSAGGYMKIIATDNGPSTATENW